MAVRMSLITCTRMRGINQKGKPFDNCSLVFVMPVDPSQNISTTQSGHQLETYGAEKVEYSFVDTFVYDDCQKLLKKHGIVDVEVETYDRPAQDGSMRSHLRMVSEVKGASKPSVVNG